MKIIQSLQNELLKNIKTLHSSKGRCANNLFIAEGLRTILGLIDSKFYNKSELKYLFYTPQALNLAEEISSKIQLFWPSIDLILLTEATMAKISVLDSPAGILGVFTIPKLNPTITPLTSGAVLAQISDPGNMGTLIRTAAAMGYQTVVIVEGADPWSPKVIQATAGTIGQVNIFKLSWPELLQHKQNLALCALVIKNGSNPKDLALDQSLLVIGNEAHGLPQDWIASCEQSMTIPMPGETESLNAAIAGSIALYVSKFN